MLWIALCLLLATGAFAQKSKHPVKAHEHGTAQINIVVDGKTALVELESPAEGILGFEHEARTPVHKQQQETALNTLRKRINEIVIFHSSAGCGFTAKKAEVVKEAGEEHSEVHAVFDVSCARPIVGTSLQFGMTRVFPRIHDVKVQILNGSQQTGMDVKDNIGSVLFTK